MSTKIWYAWRIPSNRLIEGVDTLHDFLWAKIIKHYAKLVAAVDREALKKKAIEQQWSQINEKSLERQARIIVNDEIYKAHRESLISGYRILPPELDLDTSFNLWPTAEWVYIIPYGNSTWLEELLGELPGYFQEYHYQNQTDWDAKYTQEEIDQRRHDWHHVCLGDHKFNWNSRRLNHIVFEPSPEALTALMYYDHIEGEPCL